MVLRLVMVVLAVVVVRRIACLTLDKLIKFNHVGMQHNGRMETMSVDEMYAQE